MLIPGGDYLDLMHRMADARSVKGRGRERPRHTQTRGLIESSEFSIPTFAGEVHGRQAVLNDLLSRWPLIRQIQTGTDGTGPEAMSDETRNLRPKNDGAEVTRSICPYCGVGCGQLVYHKNGKLISIEGDPESPISQGNLCPKGAASYQLLTHDRRETKMKYRAPRAKEWTEISLDRAMDMVADRVWESRELTFVHKIDNRIVNHTTAICHL